MSILHQLRKEHGEKQEDIAALLGMSAPNLSGYESGKRPLTETQIAILCDHYGISADVLLGRAPAAHADPLDGLRRVACCNSAEEFALPATIPADHVYRLDADIPDLGRAGDFAFVVQAESRADYPADCYLLAGDLEARALRHYIRQPGVELLYDGNRAELLTINGEIKASPVIWGVVRYVLHSI